MEERLREAIHKALAHVGAANTHADFSVEWPDNPSHGDYATNVALKIFGPLSHGRVNSPGKTGHQSMYQHHPLMEAKTPMELAEQLAPLIQAELGEIVEKVTVARPGFINFILSPAAVSNLIEEAVSHGDEWGESNLLAGKTYSIEYSCPNPFKEMHIGHLMSTVIGEALCRVIERGGARVVRDTYGGDVGPHVAKALWGLKEKGITEPATAQEIGDAYAHGSRAYEESERAKEEIDEINKAIYTKSDPELMELWRKGRDISVAAFRDLYKVLDTHFDYYFFESETAESGLRLVRDGLARGVFTESDGAVIFEGDKRGLHTLVFITSKGTPTYEAKEVGLAFLVEERMHADVRYILTAAEQTGHFAVVKAALEEFAPEVGKKTSHVPHGFLRLTSGKMSSREGNVITAIGLLSEVIEKAQEKNDDPLVAEQVALGAIKYMILRQAAGGDIIFDAEKSLSLDGDSGPYLQYALVRAKKLLSYESKGGGDEVPAAPYEIERHLIHFPEIVEHAVRERAPHHIAQYLTKLAGAWNSFYANEQVLGSAEEVYKQRVARAFVHTMHNGLTMLGIPTPERM